MGPIDYLEAALRHLESRKDDPPARAAVVHIKYAMPLVRDSEALEEQKQLDAAMKEP